MSDELHKVRIGVVGCGKMGLLHTSLLNTIKGVTILGVSDKNKTIRKYIKKVLNNIIVAEDAEDLCKVGVDAIYVTAPISAHFPVIKTVCSYDPKIAIFTEKTLTNSYQESLQVCNLIKGRSAPAMVGYHKRYAVTFTKAKSLLENCAIGEVYSFEAYAFSEDFLMVDKRSAAGSRGGVLRDLGSHSIDMAFSLFGDMDVRPLSVNENSFGVATRADRPISFGLKTLNDGVAGIVRVSWSTPGYHKPEVGFSILGSKGRLIVSDDKVSLVLNGAQDEQRWSRQSLNDNVPFLLAEPEYFREDEHFIDAIRTGSMTIPTNFESAMKVDRIISQVESTETVI